MACGRPSKAAHYMGVVIAAATQMCLILGGYLT